MGGTRSGRQGKSGNLAEIPFDTAEIDRWVGVPLGGNIMREAVHVNDIRRWTQGMQNPNPLFYDHDYASGSRFGQIIAPQSFTVCVSDGGGGRAPAIQGRLEGTHVLVGGDEWWFYGPRILPGDSIRQDRMLFDYRLAETHFAGLAVISRGDTTYINQHGEIVAKQRATVIRYLAEEAVKRNYFAQQREPEWTDEQLESIHRQRFAWIRSFRELGHGRRLSVKIGDRLTRRPVGPHSATSQVTEWLSFPAMVWGAFSGERFQRASTEGADWTGKAGWIEELARTPEAATLDPAYGDPMYHGPVLAHVDSRYSQLVGLPRGYGFGVSMGTWMLDYVANWAGEWGEIVHSKLSYRLPAFTGDAGFIDGEVIALDQPDSYGPIATVALSMSNQNGQVVADGAVAVRLPTETFQAT